MDEGGRESIYKLHQDTLSGVSSIVPCTNLNINILQSHVISPMRGKSQISL